MDWVKIAGLNDRRSLSAPEKTVFEMYENGKSWPQICKVMHLNYDDAKILLAQCREKGHYPDEKKREDNMKKISDDKKQRATKLISAGVDQKTIADTLQVSRSTVQRIAVQLRAETKAPETVSEPAETVSTEPATAATATSSETISNTPIINPLPEIVKPEPVAVLDPAVPEPTAKPEPPYIYSEAARDAVYSEIQRKLSHLEFVKSAIEFLEHRIAEMQADEYYTSADIERLNADLEEMGGFENA